SLENKRTLNMLQKLPSSEYFKLWKSPTQYFNKEGNCLICIQEELDVNKVRGIHQAYKDIFVRFYFCFAQIILCSTINGIKTRSVPGPHNLGSWKGVQPRNSPDLLTYMFVEKQRKNAEFLANAIKRLVLSFLDGEELALVAAVNGEATDLGLHVTPFGRRLYLGQGH
ncbi:Hypothetical protein FKW44_023240, partial [Caligus rogercresseyi]